MKKIISVVMAAVLLFVMAGFTGCSKETAKEDNTTSKKSESASDSSENPVATITMDDGKTITVELYYSEAPNTVKNFIYLANKGFYNGVIFHRVIEGFMIQGGDPDGTGRGGPGYAIKGEFAANGITNNIKHERGTISMGRTMQSYDSAGSQFFICQQAYTSGNGQYAAFGKVTDGMDVVDEIAGVSTDSQDKPLKNVVIKTITVDTKGVTYAEPETIKE